MRIFLLFAGLGGLIIASSAAAAEQEKSTLEERKQAVRYARELADDPMAAGAEQKRQWLLAWWERIPDITVTVCDLFGPPPPTAHPFFSQVVDQGLFSAGAFVIEHPERARDELAIQTAGMEGSLRVYEAYAKAQPLYRLRFVDDLLAKHKAGTLAAYLREAVPKACGTGPSR
jgi:hypothetical protein